MALIKCKNCGNDISDSALSCPHCGFEYKVEKKEEKKNYSNFSEREQKDLLEEFYRENPKYRKPNQMAEKHNKKLKIVTILLYVFWAAFLGTRFLAALFRGKIGTTVNAGTILLVIVGIAGLIGGLVVTVIIIVMRIRVRKINRATLTHEKKYKAWLQEKNISYELLLSKREKELFDAINPTEEEKLWR